VSKKKQAHDIAARKRRNQVLTVVIALVMIVITISVTYLVFFGAPGAQHRWKLDSADRLSFDAREPATYRPVSPVEDTPEYTVEEGSYTSYGDEVFALLRVPKNVSRPPVVIVLPAASINKEADSDMAKALASWGYASLTLDERGNNGKTAGPSPMDLNGGYQAFTGGGDPVQYRQAYDVLLAYDAVRSMPGLDGENVVVLGESMGGRFAIMAAALEPSIKGAVVVSSGPYGIQGDDEPSRRFMRSIEPASYLSRLPPRKLIMFHFDGDPVIPLEQGRKLYDAAGEPRAWHQYNGTVHGLYSDVYAPDLHEELRGVFGR
jgi:hypothetical protein